MSNKKLHLVFGLVLVAFVGLVGSFASAVNFKITFAGHTIPARAGYMRRNMTPIHFKDNGNNFGGFIYFSNGIGVDDDASETSDNPYIVELNGKKYECQQRAKGFYYNAERGERLRPIDDSYSMAWVDVDGGIYTRCRKEGYTDDLKNKCGEKNNESEREACEEEVRGMYVDSHGYYGRIVHTYSGHQFWLSAGTNYTVDGSQHIMGYQFAPTLIRFDNKYPVGFIYDANGGVGFLGGEITDDYDIDYIFGIYDANDGDWEKLFKPTGTGGITPVDPLIPINTDLGGSATNSLLSVIVDGLVGINRDTQNIGIEGNQSNEKMQYFSSVSINNMQLINYAKQRAENLCRGKWEDDFRNDRSIQCIDGGLTTTINAKTGYTYIVKNKNVKVKDMNNFDDDGYYDIFIDSGNLIIDEDPGFDLKVFKRNGFISDKTLDQYSGYVMPILNSDSEAYSGEEVVAGKFIKGNFIVNGNIVSQNGSGLDHVYFIYGKMTSKDTVDQLSKVFKRKCQVGIQGTDGVPCPGTERRADGVISWTNPYENASLVIIDQNYPSPLYE